MRAMAGRNALSRPRAQAGGFIIVAVLWLLAALATVAGVYAFYIRETAAAFAGHADRVQAQALTRAAVELAAFRLLGTEDRNLSRGTFSFRPASARVTVNLQPESGRIDLNAAPKELLAGLFISLGAKADSAEEHSNRILAWRTGAAPAGGSDEETSLYRVAGKPYGPRRAPFQHVDELSLVLGIPPALADRALPHVTVYSGRAEVDVLAASPQVLAALPGLNPEMLQSLLGRRDVSPQQVVQGAANYFGGATKYVSAEFGNVARVNTNIELEGRRTVRSEVVIVLLAGDTEPFRVLSWREDIEEAPAPEISRPRG
jgi:general secretion pathway protein K